jgi:flagellum-specific ATP synthase
VKTKSRRVTKTLIMQPSIGAESFSLDSYFPLARQANLTPLTGQVVRVVGLLVESIGPRARVGEVCEVWNGRNEPPLAVEVVGFRDDRLLSVPLGDTAGIRPGARIVARGLAPSMPVGNQVLGRVLDALGRPLDGLGPIDNRTRSDIHRPPVNPLARAPIVAPLGTGVRAIDAMLTCGRGQRLGLFGGSGVGKSTLLGMMARGTTADVVVLALVGERGREVRTFLDHDLGAEGLARSVVVVSTSDNPAVLRLRAAYAATAIAEHFRDEGKNVLLMMDSVTRFAMAQREIGLAAGEPPTAKGYPPSVFALLPTLLERAGNVQDRGSITGLYTVLVEGDDNNEPIADATRAILDGHIVLSRELAGRNHYPAIDVLQSVSRTMPDVTEVQHRLQAGQVREWLATIRDSEDLVSVGAYVSGANPRVDAALERRDPLRTFLCQPADTLCRYPDALESLRAVTAGARA